MSKKILPTKTLAITLPIKLQKFILVFLVTSLVTAALMIPSFAHAQEPIYETDVVAIGGGIMSASYASLLHELAPHLKIELFEKLPNLAFESSGSFSNAGTGHAALCELNYTPERPDGSIDISKAVQINQEFEMSRQFWAYLIQQNKLGTPEEFIHTVPHISWVKGQKNVEFLRKRYAALQESSLFRHLEYTEDPAVLREWMPVMMNGRSSSMVMAATRSMQGTDIDYGRLTTGLIQNLIERGGLKAFVSHEVKKLRQEKDGKWLLAIKNLQTGDIRHVRSKRLFIGAGGGTLRLLQKAKIKEANGYGGIPIWGEFFKYKGTSLAEIHFAKVYAQAAEGAPPISSPHLDTRIVDGKKYLIYGPFAGITTRNLKSGSLLDLIASLNTKNIAPMFEAASSNANLAMHVFGQEFQSKEQRMQGVREFIPDALFEEWEVDRDSGGIRVQIVHKTPGKANVLQLGTEVIATADGSATALIGASPGASIAVMAALEAIGKSFPSEIKSAPWKNKLEEIFLSYGKDLSNDEELLRSVREYTERYLHLNTNAGLASKNSTMCANFFSR